MSTKTKAQDNGKVEIPPEERRYKPDFEYSEWVFLLQVLEQIQLPDPRAKQVAASVQLKLAALQ